MEEVPAPPTSHPNDKCATPSNARNVKFRMLRPNVAHRVERGRQIVAGRPVSRLALRSPIQRGAHAPLEAAPRRLHVCRSTFNSSQSAVDVDRCGCAQ